MNLFQWLALPLLGLLFLLDLRLLFRRSSFRLDRLLRALIWLAAGVAIYRPEITSWAAHRLGIERGTDLIVYLAVLTFTGATFYLYARSVRLERQLTELARHIALDDPHSPVAERDRRGPEAPRKMDPVSCERHE